MDKKNALQTKRASTLLIFQIPPVLRGTVGFGTFDCYCRGCREFIGPIPYLARNKDQSMVIIIIYAGMSREFPLLFIDTFFENSV